MLAPWKKSYDEPWQHIKKQRHHFADKGLYSQSYGFSSSHVWMWELDHKKGWTLKSWYLRTVVLEKTLESLLMRVKEESEKSGLKLNLQKAKIMASGPITPWQVDGKKWKQWQIFIFLGSKTTADSDCTCEVKRHLLLGRKPMTNLDNVSKKQRYHFADEGPI